MPNRSAGKSTLARNISVAVLKGHDVLGRSVNVPQGGGRVLYLHLDLKDPVSYVANELRQLGVTEADSERLRLITADELPPTPQERHDWLQKQVIEFQPHLIVVDLLLQFIQGAETNDYASMLTKLNEVQFALRKVNYRGHTMTLHHARKQGGPDVADSVLGSTAIYASFQTTIFLQRRKEAGVYTIQSDQTHRDQALGELEETIVEFNADTHELTLGCKVSEMKAAEKALSHEAMAQKVVAHIFLHSQITQQSLCNELKISKKTLLPILHSEVERGTIAKKGTGEKNDPFKYSSTLGDGTANAARPQ